MSLYLPDQKLGTHSQPGSSSHKFILKGRQAGSMHRGHTWVFRAESYDTMMAWYEDIKNLTEKSGEERNAFVRNHSRSISAGSTRSVSSDGLDDNEADDVPYSAQNSDVAIKQQQPAPSRPQPGGRFPSDLTVNRHLQAPLSPSSGSSEADHDLTTPAGGLQHEQPETSTYYGSHQPHQPHQQYYVPVTEHSQAGRQQQLPPAQTQGPYEGQHIYQPQPQQVYPAQASYPPNEPDLARHNSTTTYNNWLAPAAGGAAVGVLGAEAYSKQHEKAAVQEDRAPKDSPEEPWNPTDPAPGTSAAASVSFPSVDKTSTRASSMADTLDSEAPAMATTSAAQDGHPAKIFAHAAAANEAANGSSKVSADRPTAVARSDTDFSVSQLHVPGEYPRNSISQ